MKNNKGFTLIELMIVTGLIITVASIVFSPITFSIKSFGNQNEKTNIISDLRRTMDYLTREIRKANEIEVIDNEIKIDLVVYNLENGNLVKDGNVVIEDIDELNINKLGSKIEIKIVIKDSKGENHSLSSTINIR